MEYHDSDFEPPYQPYLSPSNPPPPPFPSRASQTLCPPAALRCSAASSARMWASTNDVSGRPRASQSASTTTTGSEPGDEERVQGHQRATAVECTEDLRSYIRCDGQWTGGSARALLHQNHRWCLDAEGASLKELGALARVGDSRGDCFFLRVRRILEGRGLVGGSEG